MRDPAAPRSLSRAVYAAIRAEILAGRYAPGSKLSPRAIATQYKVSLSVVREALTRLTEQDLVVAEPQLGFSVVDLDIADVRDISRLRILIEGAGLREAIEHADVEYEARVVASHHRLSRTTYLTGEAGETVTEDWARAHAEYHSALLSACPSPRLRDLAASLRETAELYRRWSGSFSTDQAPRDVPAEHRGLMEAAPDGMVVVNQDGSPNSALDPTALGSILTFYATGEGLTNGSNLSGQAAVAPYPSPVLPVTLTVAGFPAQILYAGSAPGAVGLLQVNARVPAGFIPTGPVAAELTVGTAVAPDLTIWLK